MAVISGQRSVLLITFFDWDSAVGVRCLYEALSHAGFDTHVAHVGNSEMSANREEVLLLQCLEYDSPTRYPVPGDEDLDELVDYVKRLDPFLIGISVLSSSYQAALWATRHLRKYSDAFIVWGGVHPTMLPEQTLRDSGADAICRGEGEEAIVDLANTLITSGNFSEISNLARITEEGNYYENPVRPSTGNPDRIPFVPCDESHRAWIPSDLHEQAACNAIADDRSFYTPGVVMTGFGCPYKCSYCYSEPWSKLYKNKGSVFRRKSVARVIEECLYLRDVEKKPFIAFWDDIFTLDRKWLREFSEIFPREVGLPFFCYFHPNHAEEEVAKLAVKAGCVSAICGIQNGDEAFRRDVYHRRETNAKIIRGAKLLNPMIDMTYDMIVDCPWETEKEWRANVELFLEFPHPFKITSNHFQYLPGTSLTKRAIDEHRVSVDELFWNLEYGWDQCDHLQNQRSTLQMNYYILMNITQHPEFSREQIRRWMDDTRLIEHPESLRLEVSLRLLDKVKRLYFQEL